MKSTLHLQTEKPTMSWEEWYLQLCTLLAKAMKIDKPGASRHIDMDKAEEWYKDGFTPYATFRENFNL